MSRRRSAIATLLVALAVAAPATAGDGTFAAGRSSPVNYPVGLAVADFDNDGRADIAALDYSDRYVAVKLSKPGGGFTDAPHVDVGENPIAIVAADFDNDGYQDLAVANSDGTSVSVRLGKGGGEFEKAPDVSVPHKPAALAVGDLNADGREDLVIADHTPVTASVYVRLGSGDGKFGTAQTIDVDAAALRVGDFDGDALQDLAFAGPSGSPSGILRGQGDGKLVRGADISLPGPAGESRAWAVADVDGDGDQDLAAAVPDDGVVAVRLNDGSAKLGAGEDVPVGKSPYALAAGDFNADGKPDLAVTLYGDEKLRVLIQNGEGRLRPRAPIATGKAPLDVVVADLDSDGNDDLAVAESLFAGSVTVHRGLGKPPLAGNLLKNGGFEAPQTLAEIVPRWKLTGGTGLLAYNQASSAYVPAIAAAPLFATGGTHLLWGGDSSSTNGVTTAAQIVSVAKAAKQIDAGRARATLSAYLGGSRDYGDRMSARAEFLGAAGKTKGMLQVSPVTLQDRGKVTTLLRHAGAARVPTGSRSVRVTLTSIDDDKTLSSAMADNVKLTLDARAAFRRDAQLVFGPAVFHKPNGTVRLRVTNGNPFRVTGTLRASTVKRLGPAKKHLALGPAGLGIPSAGKQTAALALPAAARREFASAGELGLRLTAEVRDAAGHGRTLHRTVRVGPEE